jgi:AmmeMemoRadiSam system protein B
MVAFPSIRPSPIAGLWYSSDPRKLALEIDNYINNAVNPEIVGEVKGILAPHAGYRYSGATAGYAFQTVKGKSFDQVIILSPYHAYHTQSILSSAHQAYATPFGTIKIDKEFISEFREQLEDLYKIRMVEVANDQEHSLEIEIPFLQRSLIDQFSLIPIMIRSVDLGTIRKISRILVKMISGKNTLIVISTDLSHFYTQSQAIQFDKNIMDSIAGYSIENVFQTEQDGKGFACGLGAVLTGMVVTKETGCNKVKILHHATSGDETGDFESVVGYGAAVFIQEKGSGVD